VPQARNENKKTRPCKNSRARKSNLSLQFRVAGSQSSGAVILRRHLTPLRFRPQRLFNFTIPPLPNDPTIGFATLPSIWHSLTLSLIRLSTLPPLVHLVDAHPRPSRSRSRGVITSLLPSSSTQPPLAAPSPHSRESIRLYILP
jgi:hypothetical protein